MGGLRVHAGEGRRSTASSAARRSATFGKIRARREGVRKWPRTALTERYIHPRIARLPQHLPPATCSSAMAGSPLKRECNLGVVADEGSLIAFPRLNHLRSGLSHGRWRALSPGEKIERLLGMNLYRVAEILSWKPITELDARAPW